MILCKSLDVSELQFRVCNVKWEFFLKVIYLLFRDREREREKESEREDGGGAERERERESQADFILSTGPDAGLSLTTARSQPERILRVACLID